MSGNVRTLDVTELVQRIRQEVGVRTEHSIATGQKAMNGPNALQSTASLRTLDSEIDALTSQIEAGEPRPEKIGLRHKAGAFLKNRLYRFLWWQRWQIKTLTDLVSRRSKEETRLTEILSQSVAELQSLAFDYRRQVQDAESRLRNLESAQLKLQAVEIERKVSERAVQQCEPVQQTGLAKLQQQLNELKENINGAENHLATQVAHQIDIRLAELSDRLVRFNELSEAAQQIDTRFAELSDRLARLNGLSEASQQFDTRLSQLSARLDGEVSYKHDIAARLSELGLYTHQTRTALSLQDRRLSLFVEEARKRLPEPFNHEQLRKLSNDHALDALYVAFEDVFRGSREEIKTRQSRFLPVLKDNGIGSPTMPVLDLGCGRGEWLELLGENGIAASGLDRNELMLQHCRTAGLEVVQGDALDYLRSLPDSSKGAVTTFHLVEHLPFEITLAMIDESLRVLKPGGVLILETPNPQNILVGAHTFYLDPTHLKPLPSPMLRFFVEARGFCDAQVWDLHPYPKAVTLPDDGTGIANRLNDILYGPQDYAVVARKATA